MRLYSCTQAGRAQWRDNVSLDRRVHRLAIHVVAAVSCITILVEAGGVGHCDVGCASSSVASVGAGVVVSTHVVNALATNSPKVSPVERRAEQPLRLGELAPPGRRC